jgi:methionine-rich copper-binding protein CopC
MPVRIAIMAFMLCVLVPSSASAHAVLIKSDPGDTSTQKEIPGTIQMEFTESVEVFRAQVIDGCGRDVFDDVTIDGVNVTIAVAEAQPGRFKVRYDLVSGDDGHRSDGRIAFQVKGTKDCSGGSSNDGATQASEAEDEGSPPWLLIGGIAIVFILAAAAIRHRSSTRT